MLMNIVAKFHAEYRHPAMRRVLFSGFYAAFFIIRMRLKLLSALLMFTGSQLMRKLRLLSRTAVLILLISAAPFMAAETTAQAGALYPYAVGPISVKNLYAPYLPFIDLPAEAARPLQPGHLRIKGLQNYANTFRLDFGENTVNTVIVIDTENYAFTLDLAYGLFPFLEAGIAGSLVTQWGGVLDPVIVGFHNFFGFPNSGRSVYPYYKCDVVIGRWDDLWWNMHGADWGMQDITLRLKCMLFKAGDDCFHISLQSALKIPLPGGNVLFSGTQCEPAVRLLADFYFYDFALYLDGGWAYPGKPGNLPDALFFNQLFFLHAGLEWMLTKDWALHVQGKVNSSPYRISHRFLDAPVVYLTTGCRAALLPGLSLRLSFTEELFFYAATDMAVSASLVWEG